MINEVYNKPYQKALSSNIKKKSHQEMQINKVLLLNEKAIDRMKYNECL